MAFPNHGAIRNCLHKLIDETIEPFRVRNFIAHGSYAFSMTRTDAAVELTSEGETLRLGPEKVAYHVAQVARLNSEMFAALYGDLKGSRLSPADQAELASRVS